MERKDDLTKILAVAGTVLVWFPILAPLAIAVVLFTVERRLLVDYLMPMELFPFLLAGSGLLLWAASRAHSHLKWVAGGLGTAILMFFGVQGFAEISGLASGRTEPVGWIFGIAIAGLVLYTIGVLLVGTGGALLLRDLFRKKFPVM
jgi:hypothetical protein